MNEETRSNRKFKIIDLLSIAKDKKAEIRDWFLYNIGFGTIFIWLVWFVNGLKKNSSIGWYDNIINGTLAIFILTFCANQVSFYAEYINEKTLHLSRLILGVAAILYILSTVVFIISSDMSQRNDSAILIVSLFLLGGSVILCFFLFLLRLSFDAEPKLSPKRVESLTRNAQELHKIDDIQL